MQKNRDKDRDVPIDVEIDCWMDGKVIRRFCTGGDQRVHHQTPFVYLDWASHFNTKFIDRKFVT